MLPNLMIFMYLYLFDIIQIHCIVKHLLGSESNVKNIFEM